MDTNFTTLMLREKLNNLQQAVFFVHGEYEIKHLAGIVKDFTMDERGNIWFHSAHLPLSVADWNCYVAELRFYKKGTFCGVHIAGLATMTNPNSQLIKFEPDTVNYFGADHAQLLAKKYSYMKKLFSWWDMLPFANHQPMFKLG